MHEICHYPDHGVVELERKCAIYFRGGVQVVYLLLERKPALYYDAAAKS